jgi:trimeric autotransporter adhesin
MPQWRRGRAPDGRMGRGMRVDNARSSPLIGGWRHGLACALLGVLALATGWVSVAEEDPCPVSNDGWWPGFGIPGLAAAGCRKEDASARVLVVYRDRLIVGGDFAWAGGEPARNIVQWDGTAWSPLGDGVGGFLPSYVKAALVHDGCLIVGGWFDVAGGDSARCIAKWDGNAWSALGRGIHHQGTRVASVAALATFEGDLIAGGWFDRAGEDSVRCVARWDGTAWHAMGSGFGAFEIEEDGWDYSSVSALAVYHGQLIAGGSFSLAGQDSASNLAYWDGVDWRPFGSGANMGVHELRVCNDRLIALGGFTEIGGVSANGIASWNGVAWEPLGSGVSRFDGDGSTSDIAEFNGELVACGNFELAGGDSASAIAAWDGATWRPLAEGLGRSYRPGGSALQVFQGRLIVGGSFDTAGPMACRGIAQWDGSSWLTLPGATHGLDGRVQALTRHGDALIAGGWFHRSGETELSRIGQWDGSTWSPLGAGVDSTVMALASYRGDLIAGGWFTRAGGDSAAGIARWDGQAWHPLGSGVERGGVLALHVVGEDLIVGGTFERAGGKASPAIARWDGTQWTPLAEGAAAHIGGEVYALETYSGELYAAGDFGIAGGRTIQSIARWDGSAWQPLGDGLTRREYRSWARVVVRSLAVFDDRLVAAGTFAGAGGRPAANIACWDGATWQSMGEGLENDYIYDVESLCAYEGRLVAGGAFRGHVAQWDGLAWSCMGSGACRNWKVPLGILALCEYDGDLYLGGDLLEAGDRPADYIARWTDPNRGVAQGPRRLRIVPNPVREESVLHYYLPGPRSVDLTLHDVTGRMVSRLASAEQGGGWHALSWSGRDAKGTRLPPGVYFLHFDNGVSTGTGRILLVK